MIKVVTTYSYTDNGNGKVVAKCNGKQLTRKRTDHEAVLESMDRAHGSAAGDLLVKLGYSADLLDSEHTHERIDGDRQHAFTFAV